MTSEGPSLARGKLSTAVRVLAVLLALACAYSELFSLFVKLFIDVFAGSRSGTKTYLLCVFVVVFGVGPSGIVAWVKRNREGLATLTVAMLVILLLLGWSNT